MGNVSLSELFSALSHLVFLPSLRSQAPPALSRDAEWSRQMTGHCEQRGDKGLCPLRGGGKSDFQAKQKFAAVITLYH